MCVCFIPSFAVIWKVFLAYAFVEGLLLIKYVFGSKS